MDDAGEESGDEGGTEANDENGEPQDFQINCGLVNKSALDEVVLATKV
jgi:hypothetical protein